VSNTRKLTKSKQKITNNFYEALLTALLDSISSRNRRKMIIAMETNAPNSQTQRAPVCKTFFGSGSFQLNKNLIKSSKLIFILV